MKECTRLGLVKFINASNKLLIKTFWFSRCLVGDAVAYFLAQLHAVSSEEHQQEMVKYIIKYAQLVMKSQSPEGSWCHSFAYVPNPLGYRSLVATTVLALTGLGLAQHAGVDVDQDTIHRGLAIL